MIHTPTSYSHYYLLSLLLPLILLQTVVVVVDRGEGFNKKGIPTNILNLNIGKNVDNVLPSQFWLRLVNKLGILISHHTYNITYTCLYITYA